MKRIELAERLRNDDKFAMRSCWECNSSHEHLLKATGLFTCFECGRWYMDGDYFTNNAHCEEELDAEHLL